MSDKSGIEWTDATWNPVTGCAKVSQGCKHCYAEREWSRLSANPKAAKYFGRAFTDVACHEDVLDQPLCWTRPRKVFVNSMSDLFHPDVPFEFIDKVFAVMALADRHIFQVLTKRPERMLEYLLGIQDDDKDTHRWAEAAADIEGSLYALQAVAESEWPLPNVWLGVSAEDQETANERIPMLLRTPAAVRWVSAEPLLGAIDLSPYLVGHETHGTPLTGASRVGGCIGYTAPLDWVVVGGESGPKARPMHPDWVRSLRDQCDAADVPFHFKQWGEWAPNCLCNSNTPCRDIRRPDPGKPGVMFRCGKKRAGRELDGRTWDGWPKA